MSILAQLGIIFSVCCFAEALVLLFKLKIAASILAILLMFLILALKIIKFKQIEQSADFLSKNMAFFFVPSGVNIILELDLIAPIVWQLLIVCIIGTILTFLVTYGVTHGVRLLMEKKHE